MRDIKSLLDLTKSEIVALAKIGINKKSEFHQEVCKALAEGKTHEKVAEMFNLTDDAHVRYIQRTKCPECGH